MSWVVSAVVAVGVGSMAYGADANRKALHGQQDALRESEAEAARKAAEAETGAQVAANAKTADAKRRRRSSSLLASGDTGTSDTLDGAPTLLAAGGPAPAARAAAGSAASSYGGTALGAGAPASSRAGMVSTPRNPARESAL